MVAFERRQSTGITNHLLSRSIDFDGRDAGQGQLPELLKHQPRKLPRSPHLIDLFF
jgi:hypothetical protein